MLKPHRYANELLGLGLNDNDNDTNNPSTDNVNPFLGKPFYCWDTTFLGPERRDCCFNHMIFLPDKDGEKKPLFPYEKDVYDAWRNHLHLWIKKATGLGISEFFLRLMLWLCLRDDTYEGCQMCIVTGPNIDLSKKLIKRMRDLIIDYPGFKFDTETDYVLEINKCWIQAYPSHNLGSFRSLDKAKFILIDEGDFFPVGQLEEIRHVSERYIAKSNPWIVMVSTPNNPGGLFEQIENEDKNSCLYNRMFLDYKVGVGLIYSVADIEKAKQSPSFEREYNLKYGIGLGNVFIPREIDACCTLYPNKPVQVNPACSISCGVDPGFGSSRFAVTILMLEDGIIKVLYSKEWDKPSYQMMVDLIPRLKMEYKIGKIFCDAANPEFIKSCKSLFNEAQDYDRIIQRAKHDKVDPMHRMFIVPINFREWGPELLGRFQHFVSKTLFAVSPTEHKELVQQMRTARYKDNGNLDKEAVSGNTFDSFDATRLALTGFYSGGRYK